MAEAPQFERGPAVPGQLPKGAAQDANQGAQMAEQLAQQQASEQAQMAQTVQGGTSATPGGAPGAQGAAQAPEQAPGQGLGEPPVPTPTPQPRTHPNQLNEMERFHAQPEQNGTYRAQGGMKQPPPQAVIAMLPYLQQAAQAADAPPSLQHLYNLIVNHIGG